RSSDLEFERINDIKATNATFIIPINFPEAYDVENAFLASSLSLSDMRAWNQKPTNPKVLADNNITFALTTHSLKSPKDFKAHLLNAIKHGLSKEKALEALTTVPAQLLGKSTTIGSLKNGAFANFMITSGDIFDEKTTIYQHWIQGHQNVFESMNTKDTRGEYEFTSAGAAYKLPMKGELSKLSTQITRDGTTRGSKLSTKYDWPTIACTTKDSTSQDFIRIIPNAKDNALTGQAIDQNGNEMPFYAKAIPKEEKKDADKSPDASGDDKKEPETVFPVTYPNQPYGFKELPKAETILFKNATVWTNEKDGILQNTDVLIKNGKIAKIGQNLSESGATTVDATGKHLTAGIIDEHSHIAAASINEGGQNSSAEVTIEDVVDETDISIYRNLAGGVTSIQILHGSANPIGGRSAIIKLKWGE